MVRKVQAAVLGTLERSRKESFGPRPVSSASAALHPETHGHAPPGRVHGRIPDRESSFINLSR
eukprot:3658653-Amphidinium_carterae.1